MKSTFFRSTMISITSTLLAFSAIPLCAYDSSWPSTYAPLLGTLFFGGGAGALAGYIVAENQCNRGRKRSRTGPPGPPGDSHVRINTSQQLSFSFLNQNMDPTFVYNITLIDPTGSIQYRQMNIDLNAVPDDPLVFPAHVPKIEGRWFLVIDITNNAMGLTQIGEFLFQINADAPQVFIPPSQVYNTLGSPIVHEFFFNVI